MFVELLSRGFSNSFTSIYKIALILIPILVALEIAAHFKVTDYLAEKLEPFAKALTLPKEASFPLMVGMVFGIILGAAVILDYAREGHLAKRDLILISLYISFNHSIFEDNIVFAALGAKVVPIFVIRFILAFIVVRVSAYVMDHRTLSAQKSMGK